MTIKRGSMKDVVNSIYQILINDEELLRLLYYLPKRKSKEKKEPLDSTLPNIKDRDDYWDIVDERIVLGEKVSEIIKDGICRIYISSGRRRPDYNSYLLAKQQIRIQIYVHEDYLSDLRLDSISDRLNELLCLERLNGAMGMFEYIGGDPISAPQQYQGYVHVYQYSTGKK